jgi:hypothetical protein
VVIIYGWHYSTFGGLGRFSSFLIV